MFYELSLVVFSGSQNNKKYHNKKMVFWDNDKKIAICSTQFKSEILSIKVIKKLTFVGTKGEINICNFNETYNVIEILSKVILDSTDSPFFEVWLSNYDKKYYLANISNKDCIDITVIYENCLETSKIRTFSTDFVNKGIQNLFFIEKLNILFIIENNGSYIKGFCCSDFYLKYEFYRGNSYSVISSITCINQNYIAVASGNKTIHIFQLITCENNNQIINSNKFSLFSGYIYNLIINPYKLNKSILKIRLNEIEKDEEFFDYDFKKKGTILLFNENSQELTCLGYNGKIYLIKINFDNNSYEIKNKFTWCFFDDIKNSQYTSEDFSFDLMGWNKKKEEKINNENWKII